jgi:hypothetical protein
MKLDASTLPYLTGNKFSNSLSVPLDYHEPIPNRVNFLKDYTQGKHVIHLGCLDHLPLIDDKISRGQWLHKVLSENTARCIGIDIDKEAFEHVTHKHGFKNILLGDFTRQKFEEITTSRWDYAVLGELLEHIDNPVAFLSSIRDNYAGNLDKIIITVPNAWTQVTMRKAKQSIEIINSDHRYWFTPYTLSKVILQAGMQVEEIFFANRVPLTTMELIKAKIAKAAGITPKYNFTYASSIIAVAKVNVNG